MWCIMFLDDAPQRIWAFRVTNDSVRFIQNEARSTLYGIFLQRIIFQIVQVCKQNSFGILTKFHGQSSEKVFPLFQYNFDQIALIWK